MTCHCRINIVNQSSQTLIGCKYFDTHGTYKSHPEADLKPGQSTRFEMEGNEFWGIEGSLSYIIGESGKKLDVEYSCIPVTHEVLKTSSNNLSFEDNSEELKIEAYGGRKDYYIERIPPGQEGQYPLYSGTLSGIFVISDK
ncbi:MAG: hypothetical protein OIF57_17320 [Marinobacterium sp.]|nr:hypothetical protein [Marinobacterium sp.]